MGVSSPSMLNAESCPQCGGALENAQGQVYVACPFCSVELTRTLSPIESMKRALEKRASVEPKMNALMNVYAQHLGAGRKAEALVYYECSSTSCSTPRTKSTISTSSRPWRHR